MMLQIVNANHPPSLLNKHSILIRTPIRLLIALPNLQNILQPIQRNLNNLIIRALQQVTQWLDAPLTNKVPNLTRFLQAPTSSVRHSPARLLLRLEVSVLENVDEGRDDVGVDDGLNLRRRTSGDVGDGPARFFADPFFGRGEEREESGEGTGSEDNLGLHVVPGDDVADRTESRRLDRGGVVPGTE